MRLLCPLPDEFVSRKRFVKVHHAQEAAGERAKVEATIHRPHWLLLRRAKDIPARADVKPRIVKAASISLSNHARQPRAEGSATKAAVCGPGQLSRWIMNDPGRPGLLMRTSDQCRRPLMGTRSHLAPRMRAVPPKLCPPQQLFAILSAPVPSLYVTWPDLAHVYSRTSHGALVTGCRDAEQEAGKSRAKMLHRRHLHASATMKSRCPAAPSSARAEATWASKSSSGSSVMSTSSGALPPAASGCSVARRAPACINAAIGGGGADVSARASRAMSSSVAGFCCLCCCGGAGRQTARASAAATACGGRGGARSGAERMPSVDSMQMLKTHHEQVVTRPGRGCSSPCPGPRPRRTCPQTA